MQASSLESAAQFATVLRILPGRDIHPESCSYRVISDPLNRTEQGEVLKFFAGGHDDFASAVLTQSTNVTSRGTKESYGALWQKVSSIEDVSFCDSDLMCCSNSGMLASAEESCCMVLPHLFGTSS